MKINFLDKNAKLACLALPTKLAQKELENIIQVLASSVRLTRGYKGLIIQRKTHPVFKVETESVDAYPYVISEDHETNPFVPLIEDASSPLLMWVMQSSSNLKWLIDYAQEIVKRHEVKTTEVFTRVIKAIGETEFVTEFKTKTPPPYLNLPKGCIKPSVEDSYRLALHFVANPTWLGDAPDWWSRDTNEKLTNNKKGKRA
jgi:hypothetical protein